MSGINVSNRKTLGRKMMNYVGLGVAGATIYFGSQVAQTVYKNMQESDRIETVAEALNKNDHTKARKLLEEFEQKGLLDKEDIIDLKKSYVDRRNNVVYGPTPDDLEMKVYALINNNSLDSARVMIKELEESGFYSASEIVKLESDVESHTEEHLRNIWSVNDLSDASRAASDYLDRYPKGQYHGEAAAIEIRSLFNSLDMDLKVMEGIDNVKSSLEKINGDLERYSNKKASIRDKVDVSSIRSRLYSFVNELSNPKSVTRGEMVKITNPSPASWNEQYYKERNFIIPTGSEGEIVNIEEEDNSVYLKFNEITKDVWRGEWSFLNQYKDGNVAKYKMSEIKVLPKITPEQRNEFLKEIKRMELNLQQYK